MHNNTMCDMTMLTVFKATNGLEGKNAFLGYKNKKFKKSKI